MAKEMQRIKSFKIYLDGEMVGTSETADYAIMGNDEQHVTAEGVNYSDGTVTTEVNVNTIVVVTGRTQKVTQAILKKKNMTVQVGLVDGQIHRIDMRCLEHRFNTDHKSGGLKGAFKLGGGAPEIT